MQMQDLSYKLNNQVLIVEDKKNELSFEASVEVYSLENTYTVKEDPIAGYTSSVDGYKITNTLDTTKVDVIKFECSLKNLIKS